MSTHAEASLFQTLDHSFTPRAVEELETPTSFEEFWPHYVGAHRDPLCRAIHYVGTTLALGAVTYSILTLNPFAFLAAPVLGYGFAWIGHFGIEKNRPATFGNPLWSLRGDFKMLSLAVRGKMADEVTRLFGSAAPAKDAPLLSRL